MAYRQEDLKKRLIEDGRKNVTENAVYKNNLEGWVNDWGKFEMMDKLALDGRLEDFTAAGVKCDARKWVDWYCDWCPKEYGTKFWSITCKETSCDKYKKQIADMKKDITSLYKKWV